MLINLTNHPKEQWTNEQLSNAASEYGSVEDMGFPEIDPALSLKEVKAIAGKYFRLLKEKLLCTSDSKNAVHLMGEFTFTHELLLLLRDAGIKAVASTSKREVFEEKKGKKLIRFYFIRFREYY